MNEAHVGRLVHDPQLLIDMRKSGYSCGRLSISVVLVAAHGHRVGIVVLDPVLGSALWTYNWRDSICHLPSYGCSGKETSG